MTATSGRVSASQRRTGTKPSKNGFQYGSSCSLRWIAPPIAGTCEVVMPPMILAISNLLAGRDELGLELFLGHAGLLGADVLHVQAEDAGELGEVVGVAAGGQQLQHVARTDRLALLGVQAVLRAIGVLVRLEGGTVGGV